MLDVSVNKKIVEGGYSLFQCQGQNAKPYRVSEMHRALSPGHEQPLM